MKSEVVKTVLEEFKHMKESFWTEFKVRTLKKGYSIIEITVMHWSRGGGSTRV